MQWCGVDMELVITELKLFFIIIIIAAAWHRPGAAIGY